MQTLNSQTATVLARAIGDQLNPATAAEAAAVAERYLQDSEFGLLDMSAESRSMLEAALAGTD